MKGLSVVLPAYNEEEMIPIITEALTGRLEQEKILYELIFVSDGSTDDTWEAIEKETGKNDRVRGVEFSRNFGKDSAIFAGMAQAVMDAVAVMDCDLQHPVDTLISMYRIWENGSEIVEGIKSQRGRENLLYRKGVGWFYRILSKTLKMDMENASDFKLMDRKVVDSLLQMPERHLFFRAVSAWAGYRTTQVKYQVGERPKGKSKWNLRSLISYGFQNIVAFTTLPLQFVTIGGVICFLGSVLLAIYSLVRYFQGQAVEGYTTLLMVLLVIGSGIMISLGIIGFYIGKIYDEVRRRPRYLISRITRKKEDEK